MISSLKLKVEQLLIDILCLLLFIKNLIFSKRLTVESFLYPTKVIIRGHAVELNWTAKGCHRILINNSIILPGNLSHKSLILRDIKNEIEVVFCGIGGQKETKKILIETISPIILSEFSPKITLSSLSSVPLVYRDIKKTFPNLIVCNSLIKINSSKTNFNIQSLENSIESIVKSNYPI